VFKKIILTLIICSCSLLAWSKEGSIDDGRILSYRGWKSERIQSILVRIGQQRAHLAKAQIEGKKDMALQAERLLKQEEWNLEVAQDLSVSDYIVLYLSGQSAANKFYQAAQQMTVAETSELIEAFARETGPSGEQSPGAKISVDAQSLKMLEK
jgi:hypothetical protein